MDYIKQSMKTATDFVNVEAAQVELVGKGFEEAKNEFTLRKVNNECVREDYRAYRINVWVENGVITKVAGFY